FWRHARRPVPIVTGFIGRTADGRTTTIGRNGSDYTAAIIGAALGASMIEIWTDVDGVLSADPKAVSSAFVLPQITYEEAMEMSYFGAKVLHAGTIAPAVARSIPIVIKNSLNPSAPGTLISSRPTNGYRLAKGISSIGALGRHNINISAIAQGASERNISCVVDAAQQARALNVIHQGFFEQRRSLALVVVGVGNIGGALLRQLRERRSYLLEQGFDAKV